MKKLLTLLFSLFFFCSPSVFADDISDFEIEGMSIGDSLLDYMTEDEIFKEIELTKDMYSYLEPNKYVEVYLWKDFPVYDMVSVKLQYISSSKYVANKNEEYKILNLRGMIRYVEDFDRCIVKRDEIAEELSMMFPNARKIEDVFKHPADPSGNSIVEGIYFYLDLGNQATVVCMNMDETYRIKRNLTEGLEVTVDTKEIISWLENY